MATVKEGQLLSAVTLLRARRRNTKIEVRMQLHFAVEHDNEWELIVTRNTISIHERIAVTLAIDK